MEDRRKALIAAGRSAARLGMKDRVSALELAAQLAAQAPAEWMATVGHGWTMTGLDYDVETRDEFAKFEHVIFKRDDATIVLTIETVAAKRSTNFYSAVMRESAYRGCCVQGHTLLRGGSFTRSGIDTHSCALVAAETKRYSHDYGDLAALLAGEFERCRAADARSKTAVAIPGLPFTRQPDWFEKTSAALADGKVVRLTPSGFGTGYSLYTGRPSRFAKRADPALEAKLGTTAIWIETFDHD